MKIKKYIHILLLSSSVSHAATTVVSSTDTVADGSAVSHSFDIDGDSLNDLTISYTNSYTSTLLSSTSFNADVSLSGVSFTDTSSTLTINSVNFDEFTSYTHFSSNGGTNFYFSVNGGSSIQQLGTASTAVAGNYGQTLEFDYVQRFAGHVNFTSFVKDFSVDYDTVVVPEPTSAALLGIGGLALLARRKR